MSPFRYLLSLFRRRASLSKNELARFRRQAVQADFVRFAADRRASVRQRGRRAKPKETDRA